MSETQTPGQLCYEAFDAAYPADRFVRLPWDEQAAPVQAAWEAAAQAVLRPTQTDRHAAYHERNMLVAYLATCYPAHLARHPEQEPWDDDWRWLICVHTPAGQMTWHIHDSAYPLFRWLPARNNDWDGHTTEEKYTCLLGLIVERGGTDA